ncbi:MAG: MptD family putative ECF transporter S component [Lachnospiraceae bacterium]|nr:MptD family putative ECF transporter S component [Lachnospiraceae bacterium]
MNNRKLTGKDLITVGIYTAIYMIVIFVIGATNAIPILYPPSLFVMPLLAGIPMMLYYSKIEKFGMLTITGIIMGLFFYICGYTWICLAFLVPTALLGDIILNRMGYKKFSSMLVSYMVFSLGIMGGPANLWFAGASYWDGISESMGAQYAEQLSKYMPSWMFPLGFVLLALGAFCGAFLGRKMLNKHFKKAGIA